jgi:hypothetical protein
VITALLLTASFWLGTWRIDSAAVAPWVEPGRTPDASEMKSLLGKTVTFEAARIRGPRPLACPKLQYALFDRPPEALFQGMFEQMQGRDPSVQPAKVAEALGFKSSSVRTLETGCANELDFHFVDETTAMFGLNDYIYRLRRK